MLTLALETAGKVASIAIAQDDTLLFEQSLDIGLTHSEVLLPMVEYALKACSLCIEALDKIAVDIGPGSFTGIRICVCSANALAFALKKPVVGISSLDILAANAPYSGNVVSLIDARNAQVYGGWFASANGNFRQAQPYFAGDIDEFLLELPLESALFIGDGALAQHARIRLRWGDKALFAPTRLNACSAGTLALLAQKLPGQAQALPLYLRATQAERLRAQAQCQVDDGKRND